MKTQLRFATFLSLCLIFFTSITYAQLGSWTLVTDGSSLQVGDQVVIAAMDSAYALSITQGTNNRSAVAITKSSNSLTLNENVQVFTLEAGTKPATFAFSTGSGYIYAAGGGNRLRTKSEKDSLGSFSISIAASGSATIKSQLQESGRDPRNWLRYNHNNGSPIFSCYASGQKDVCLYKFTEAVQTTVQAPEFSLTPGRYYTSQTISLTCATSGATIYYTVDGSTPDSSSIRYNGSFTLDTTTTIKAIAKLNNDYSLVSTATYSFPVVVNNIAALRNMPTGNTLYRLAGNALVSFTNTTRNAKYIQDATAGILIDDPQGVITNTYYTGDEITDLVGTLTVYRQLLEFVPVIDIPAAVSSGNTIIPTDVTLQNMGNYESQLVRLSNIIIDTAAASTFVAGTNYILNGSAVTLYTKFSDLDYIGAAVPTTPQDIVGVVHNYNGTYSIIPRSTNDFSESAQLQTYTVSYNVSGNTSLLSPSSYTQGDSPLTLPSLTASCGDWTFLGWTADPLSSATIVAPEMIESPFTPTSDITLYALFTKGDDALTPLSYQEVTTTPSDWTGTYLIGYKDEQDTVRLFNGVDESNNGVVILNSTATILAKPADAVEVRVTPMEGGYALQLLQGVNADKYIYGQSDQNKLLYHTTPQLNTINFVDSVSSVAIVSNTSVLRFNTASNQQRFRYYKSTTTNYPLVSLYKKQGGETLYATTLPMDTTEIAATICDGDTYTENGFNVSEAGTYTRVVSSSAICTEVLKLTLTVVEPVTMRESATACQSYTWERTGVTYTQSGSYEHTLTSQNGCDSVNFILALTINNGTRTILEPVDTCMAQNVAYTWTWEGQSTTCTQSGTYTLIAMNDNGCYDTAVRQINIYRTVRTDIAASICEGETYSENGFNVALAGVYTRNLQTINGCDSIVTLTLTVGSERVNNLQDEICLGYGYQEYGFNIPASELTEARLYTFSRTIVRPGICDSIVNLALIVKPTTTREVSETVCGSYTWNGQIYTTNGDYTQTLTATNGCDSVVTLHLTINQPVTNEVSETACGSYTWNGQTLTYSGDYHQTLTAANGCDSVVTLHLTINQPVTIEVSETACESYTWNGQTYTTSGDYTQTLTAANGCDSVVTLHLTINQPVTNEVSETACESYVWNGQTLTYSGDYHQTLTAANGCDSVVTLHLTINQPVTNEVSETACESYVWNGQTYTTSGDYTQTLIAANGCDSVVTLHLTIDEMPEVTISGNTEIAAGEETTLSATYNEQWTYLWSTEETTASIVVAPDVTTQYTVTVQNGSCEANAQVTVNVSVGVTDYTTARINLYPNPVDQYCVIEGEGMQEVTIFAMSGQKVATYKVGQERQYRLSTAALMQGTYFVKVVTAEGNVLVTKMIVKH